MVLLVGVVGVDCSDVLFVLFGGIGRESFLVSFSEGSGTTGSYYTPIS